MTNMLASDVVFKGTRMFGNLDVTYYQKIFKVG